jgi:uncharacterized protein (DUF924 family)
MDYAEVLAFWFEACDRKQWWRADAAFDALIVERFGKIHRQAAQAELSDWRQEPKGRLAEIIVLDQFSRNIHRQTPLAFAQDSMALVLAQEAIVAHADAALSPLERSFLYLPFMHSESKKIHAQALLLYRANGLTDNYDFEVRHKAIIDRFGRYPHRNEVLGRASTPEELEFLKQPGSRF